MLIMWILCTVIWSGKPQLGTGMLWNQSVEFSTNELGKVHRVKKYFNKIWKPIEYFFLNTCSMHLEYSVQCDEYWWGRQCSSYCRPQNTASGHYNCNQSTGDKICLEGKRNVDLRQSTTYLLCMYISLLCTFITGYDYLYLQAGGENFAPS